MQFTRLGQTGVEVSRLCFGAMSFGGEADEATSAALFNRCREAGINFFDCANVYSQGKAEEILGRLIRPCRDELVITSKVFGSMNGGPKGLSRRQIMRHVEDSLRRLGTDRLDVCFCHMFDPTTVVEDTLRAMDDMFSQGKVVYIGVSNWSAWQVALGLGTCERLGLNKIRVLQPMYSLAKRAAEIEILPLALDQKLAVISYSPLGGGLLTGKYAPGRKDPAGRLSTNPVYAIRYADERCYQLAERFTAYARQAGVHPVTLAVAWVKSHPAITAPIIGARNLEQLAPALAAADYVMSAQQRQEIADLTGPVPIATDRDEERPARV